ncbi:ImmA/IrrE family metallo-endopeptidase [Mesorhizobium sp. WSM4906]|uniref:ImmA/IrrE family metallo-endopeptidase n=1 Tax=Mesorhizobium sp. WSM4906 TaxID=3038546 RepID=UPI00241602F8|nr:ImmA/IrrE family metallo-endopeptidase [Mesorhizobium sp. WSM4906]WFP74016.1 hypothetical protein QAZ22_19930 [Mesorhizobium sp. WSM4906]
MFKLEFDWEDPGKAKGDELRATWSRFAIKVDGHYVTRVTDLSLRSVRDAVYLPLYPLAEWIAENWFFLQFEAHTYESREAFWRRHSFVWADSGYSFPQFLIQPTGLHTDLVWIPKYKGYSTIEYLGKGSSTSLTSQVIDELRNLLDAVNGRLESFGIFGTHFQNEWRFISEMNSDEIDFARMAASSGIDPFNMEESIEEGIILLSQKLPLESLARFLTATRGSHFSDRALWLDKSLTQLDRLKGGLSAIPSIVAKSNKLRLNQEKKKAPFQWGYDVARKIRSEFSLHNDPVPSVANLASLFGVHEFEDSILIDREAFSQVRSLSTGGQNPRFKITTRRPDSDTFALARGIFDRITAPELSVNVVADTDLEADKASRAFAAEFLLPSSVLRERQAKSQENVWYEDDVLELAEEYHVSEYVVRHQLENHNIGHIVS